MIRVSRLTDYSIVVLSYMASRPKSVMTARELSESSRLPLPTVSKVLKSLCKVALIESYRGVNGGYLLSKPPKDILVLEVIDKLDGVLGMTSCMAADANQCMIEEHCPVKDPWQKINIAVRNALSKLNLLEMSQSIAVVKIGVNHE